MAPIAAKSILTPATACAMLKVHSHVCIWRLISYCFDDNIGYEYEIIINDAAPTSHLSRLQIYTTKVRIRKSDEICKVKKMYKGSCLLGYLWFCCESSIGPSTPLQGNA